MVYLPEIVTKNQEELKKTKSITREARTYAENIFRNHLPVDISYHNATHTEDVVAGALEIGRAIDLSEDDLEVLELAAWFHDVGYSEVITDHEDVSARIALSFLSEAGYPDMKAARVSGCIMATKMPQTPKNPTEQALCDADLLHLATENFFDKTRLLHNELVTACGLKITDTEWMEKNVKFISAHQYFTPYAREKYGNAKKRNLEKVTKLLEEMKSENESDPDHKDKKKKKKKDKDKGPERGIETMFRLTSKNHLDLSAMADNKANIMISINAIILSVLISVLVRKLEEYPHMLVPTLILTLVCLVTIVFSILVTRPQIAKGKFTKEDIEKKKVNLLFFGNFHKMGREEYEWAMKEMMKDGDYLYSNLIRDIYYLGVVLGKKYRLLRIAYTFFMFGFVISIISFLIAELFFRAPYPY